MNSTLPIQDELSLKQLATIAVLGFAVYAVVALALRAAEFSSPTLF